MRYHFNLKLKLNRNCFPVKTETIKIFDMNKLGKSVNQPQSFDLWQAKKNICWQKVESKFKEKRILASMFLLLKNLVKWPAQKLKRQEYWLSSTTSPISSWNNTHKILSQTHMHLAQCTLEVHYSSTVARLIKKIRQMAAALWRCHQRCRRDDGQPAHSKSIHCYYCAT